MISGYVRVCQNSVDFLGHDHYQYSNAKSLKFASYVNYFVRLMENPCYLRRFFLGVVRFLDLYNRHLGVADHVRRFQVIALNAAH